MRRYCRAWRILQNVFFRKNWLRSSREGALQIWQKLAKFRKTQRNMHFRNENAFLQRKKHSRSEQCIFGAKLSVGSRRSAEGEQADYQHAEGYPALRHHDAEISSKMQMLQNISIHIFC